MMVSLALFGAVSAASAEDTIAQGTFVGKSGHTVSGGVRVLRTPSGTAVVLDEDFRFDGAPDPKLGFGRNGYDKDSKFSALRANSGRQVYDLPASIDPSSYNELWVWCERYAVPLGVAKLH
jgi:hypothetical protein